LDLLGVLVLKRQFAFYKLLSPHRNCVAGVYTNLQMSNTLLQSWSGNSCLLGWLVQLRQLLPEKPLMQVTAGK